MTKSLNYSAGDPLATGPRGRYRGAHRRTRRRIRLHRWAAARMRALAARLDPIPPRMIVMTAAR